MLEITVNDVAITPQAIIAETQNHPAGSAGEAEAEAARALVVRELLLQEARRVGFRPDPQRDDKGRTETDEDALIRQLLDDRITILEAEEAACRRYFENNHQRFYSPALFEPAHILLSATPDDRDGYAAAVKEAASLIALLSKKPEAFDDLARDRSDCSSKQSGGRLGQVMLRNVVPEFATFLAGLEEGQLCPVPVKTRYGVHVLRLDRKVEGRLLPFEAVAERIATYLQEMFWRRSIAEFIEALAANASIKNMDIGQ